VRPESLSPTTLIDSDHPAVRAFAAEHGRGPDDRKRAVELYYAVRDGYRYDPYRLDLTTDGMKASSVLARGHGWCVPKATLLAAACRARGIPARLGFADVRNHLSTRRMRELMRTDVFHWHGYTEILLDGTWRKATPAFNVELCERFDLRPLEFDGRADSLYHPFDRQGRRHMEYVHDRGSYDDVPLEQIRKDFLTLYPAWDRGVLEAGHAHFESEVRRENPSAGGRWDPGRYAREARFVPDLGLPVVELLEPRPGERVLDLGCGDGTLTVQLISSGCAVIGVDASPEMVEAARRLGIDARVMDGRALQFEREFDAVFSNAALHWMTEPASVVDGVWRALRPGGRFVGEFGARGNVARIRAALFDVLARHDIPALEPWYFPTAEEYADLLAQRGFVVQSAMAFERPTPLPGGLAGWLETFWDGPLSALEPVATRAIINEVVDRLRPTLCSADGTWTADYVRLRFSATRPD
jgi:SAM-dependent methyltransferase